MRASIKKPLSYVTAPPAECSEYDIVRRVTIAAFEEAIETVLFLADRPYEPDESLMTELGTFSAREVAIVLKSKLDARLAQLNRNYRAQNMAPNVHPANPAAKLKA